MATDIQKQMMEKHLDSIRGFMLDLEFELQNLDKVEWVVMMRSGLPLKWEIGSNGQLVEAEQTGILYASKTTNRALAFRIARAVKCGKDIGGQVMTYAELIEDAKKKQEKLLIQAEIALDELDDEE